jgi:hypothetical protein
MPPYAAMITTMRGTMRSENRRAHAQAKVCQVMEAEAGSGK